ncbi:MAG TPA: SLC13 family permease [Acidimicrobiales bacterium]|nr:SLC13 family permease [Acidimicrobiales bacterium]
MLSRALAVMGAAGAALAAGFAPGSARASAAQDWPSFVLVAGLLLIGLVAQEDRLFSAAGQYLAGLTRHSGLMFVGAVGLVAVVTAVLNLDTSVAFLTPVLLYTARARGEVEAPLLYGCLLLSNAASLLLPGSNLTNLIVLGHFHLSGGRFASRMALPWVGAIIVTAAVVAVMERRSPRRGTTRAAGLSRDRPRIGLGLASVVAAVVLVLVLRNPALPVAGVGVLAVGLRLAHRRERLAQVLEILGLPVLAGLFGIAVTLGAAGREWDGPALMLSHLDRWATAPVAAAVSLLVNNLPAASLLAARTPSHPFALLVGLNLGPNLFVTGSLAWVLWLRAAATAGSRPSIRHASRLGAVAVPLSIAAALGMLTLAGIN